MVVDHLPKAKVNHYIRENRKIDYGIMKELHDTEGWSISSMCSILEISRSAYYKWLNRKSSEKEIEDQKIAVRIKEIAESNNSLFGVGKMTAVLRNRYHFTCNHKRVYRLMCINGIQSGFRRKERYNYRRSTPEETAENILARDFNAERPNEKWCSDVTEITVPATGHKLYLSPVIDLYGLYPVGYAISRRNDTALTNDALASVHNAFPEATPTYHTDRGFQYTRRAFKHQLEEYGMTQSMSRVSKCIDNGPCENFQGIIKAMMAVLYPDARTEEETMEAIHGTIYYYVNEYPQKRFGWKTSGEVHAEGLKSSEPKSYPIKQALRIKKFWADIEARKQRAAQQAVSGNKSL